MRCSYCSLPAEAKCACSLPFMCLTHLGNHLETMCDHSCEPLDIELGSERLKTLRSKTLKEVQNLNTLKVDITVKTRILIESIEKLFKMSLEKFDAFSNSYLCILKQNKFTMSDLDTIIKIENMDLKVNIINIENIKNLIEFDYSQVFFEKEIDNCERNRRLKEDIKRNEKERKRKVEEENKRTEHERNGEIDENERIKKEEKEHKRILKKRKRQEDNELRLHPEISNNEIGMTLRKKINYFFDMVLGPCGMHLDGCRMHGKEAIVSRNGKYLFFCMLYSGILYQDCTLYQDRI